MHTNNTCNGKQDTLIKFALYRLLPLLCLLAYLPHVQASQSATAELHMISYEADEIELTASCYLTDSEQVVVFLPNVYAPFEEQEKLAGEIAKDGLSACFSHVFTDLFLPMENKYYRDIPLDSMLALLDNIRQQTGRQLYLIAHGSGNRVAYQLAHRSLHSADSNRHTLSGMILLSPNLLNGTPAPGKDQQYMPIIHEKTVPIFIYQPVYSPHHWHLDTLVELIKKSGTRIRYKQLPNARDGYALREDRTPNEETLRAQAAAMFKDAIEQLTQP
jgi:hypothetical protein